MMPIVLPPHARQQGVALILVLWILALMTIMAGSFALSTQRESSLIINSRDRAKAVALADGGIHYAMFMLSLPNAAQRWRADGTPYRVTIGGVPVEVRIFDEGGKVDLNAARESTLRTLLSKVTQDEDLAVKLTDAILDWRDNDDLKRLNGAEAAEYLAAGLDQMPQNRNFLVLEELRGVLGVTPSLYRKLEPLFTIYSNADGVNPAKASASVLLALTDGNSQLVDDYIAAREAGNGIAAAPPLPPVPGIPFHSFGDSVYTVLARPLSRSRSEPPVKAVIRREARQPRGTPFVFLRWQPQTPGVLTDS
ncbi:type II secretion system minor pseudopilin [Methylocaldum szegediense]|uniref:General secretion pathway protein K n=1 Tax=Methylocaldum szegediense TaxID=73780 RepID=A0ABM9I1W7_9GAMM|nr:type II secretion system protein GspK [Methylocaldum szegediense]CAI8834830.1 general secretion pathway protein K [Methylocaldum szegediense]